jgi:hypothetical protein
LKLGFTLLALMGALLFPLGGQVDPGKCMATCMDRCTASLTACKKSGQAMLSCQKAYNTCQAGCQKECFGAKR